MSIVKCEVPSASALDRRLVEAAYFKDSYRAPLIGEHIGRQHKSVVDTEDELIAGRDNRHLDFRLSILRNATATGANVTVSTICNVHNNAGKIYLFFIVPFHRWGVRRMLARARRG